MKPIIPLVLLLALTACGKQETYSLVQVCNGPFMRRDKEAVYKRDSDGKLFYKGTGGIFVAVAEGADLRKICR